MSHASHATLLNQMKSALRAGVPLLAITTPDPWETITTVCAGTGPELAKLEWDYARGLTGRNKLGVEAVAELGSEQPTAEQPFYALVLAARLRPRSILFVHLADKWLASEPIMQAVWNLRDVFKGDRRMLVLLSKTGKFPGELADDIVTIDEPLPGGDELARIVREQHAGVGLDCDAETVEKASEALRGLTAFGAEQLTCMSFGTKSEGLRIDALWDRKRQQVEQTPGLKIFRGGAGSGDRAGETFQGIGGCDVIKDFLSRILQGHGRPNAVIFIDEIEKAMGGAKGDMSGVTQDQLGALLSYMQDNSSSGLIFIGPPGAAKSAVAKAAGAEAGIPTIQLDLGAMKGSLVGQSEHQLRAALKVITAVSNSRALFIATCNSIGELPPELRRRFTLGTFFFDLPSAEEREKIWDIWLAKYELFPKATDSVSKTSEWPNDEGWTGAEIRQCCDIAWRLGCRMDEAAAFVVPVSRSAAETIRKLREQASGKFLSASYPGVFEADKKSRTAAPDEVKKKRALKLEE